MTVATDASTFPYTGNGVTTTFNFGSRILEASDLTVYLDGVIQVSGFSVLNVGSDTSDVQFAVAPANGVVITLTRNVPFTQTSDYVDGDDFPAETHERALDKLTMMAQQLKGLVNRAVRFAVTVSGVTPEIVETPVAGNTLMFTDNAGRIGLGPNAADIVAAGPAAATAVAAANTATAQATIATNAAAGFKVKESVRAATTANITLSGTQTIDGVALTAGQRVLVKNQTTTSQNGIYVVAAGAWSRATDSASWNQLVSAQVSVDEGSTQADSQWFCSINLGGTIGVTAVTWINTPIFVPDGFLGFVKLATAAIATLADIVAGTANKIVTASVLKSMRYDSGLIAMPAATTYDFTGIPAGTKRITLTYMNLSSTATFLPWLRLGSGGVPVTSGYTGCVSQYANTIAATTLSSAFWFMQSGTAATSAFSGIIQMELVDEVTNTWVVNSVGAAVAGGTAGNNMCGMVSLPAALNMLRFGVDAGNMDSGSARVVAEVW